MNKTIAITLNGIIFHFEEEAYNKLKEYLDKIRKNLDDADRDEVMADIEASMAEKCTEKISTIKQVVTLADVNEFIRVMGTVEDFDRELNDSAVGKGGENKNEESKKENQIPKKLYRNPDDSIIAGVCSGLAAYFGVDAVFVRLFFAISIFFGGTGVILYFILWVIVPEAKTSTQKLEMNGDPVTLEGIKQAVKKNVDRLKENESGEVIKGSLKKVLALPFMLFDLLIRFMKRVFSFVIPFFRIIFGLGITFGMIAGITALSFVASVFVFNPNSPYIVSDIPFREIFGIVPYTIGVISVYFTALIPIIFILLMGISLLRKKNSFTLLLCSFLVCIWIVAVVMVGLLGIEHGQVIQEKVENLNNTQREI